MKASTAILNRAIKNAQEVAQQARNSVQELKGKRRLLGRIVNALAKSLGNQEHSMFVGTAGAVHISMHDLSGFKCMELEMVLNTLENLGTAKRTKDWAEYHNRDYFYEVDGVDVFLSVYIKADSETCKRVAVGTKIEERIQYELRCS